MTVKEKTKTNPITETFRDITPSRLIKSSWTVFLRIRNLQGTKAALRVFPIVWIIIKVVRGLSKFHAQEYERNKVSNVASDAEEQAMTNEEYDEYRELGRWLTRKLHDLGPTFIKIGQTLSTRADLMPLPAMLELSKLQENVDKFELEIAREIINRELGAYPEDLYEEFNPQPIAAASLAQAYKAKLKDGRDVVVKVQRPGLSHIIAQDIQILGAVADEVMNYPKLCRHTNWPDVNEEFARTIFEEIDYIREGRNADTFRRNFRDFEQIYIPRIIWRLTGRRVLTIEYVSGVRVDDVEAIDGMGLLREDITRLGAKFYLRQLLEDGFFHADPHPGNLRVMEDGRIGVFDFGMVGHLSPDLKMHLINALIHVTQRDYRSLVDDFIGMRFLPEDVDREKLCADLTPILDTRFSEGMSTVRFRKMLFDFSDVVYQYPFQLPSEFTYVMRALLTLEGVALSINPRFNFIDAALPFAHKLLLKNNKVIRQALLKEVFTDGKFNKNAAVKLIKSAASLTGALLN